MLVLCFLFSSEKLDSPIAKPYTERSIAKKPVPPISPPIFPSRKSSSTTAAANSPKEAAARPTDSLPLAAYLFFANAYLYLLAIMFSPKNFADCINSISQCCSQSIQYHIIHIKTSNFRDKLDRLHTQADAESG